MSDFQSSLLTLGDDAFFELIRNYLGPIKTPFNKHDLISQLEKLVRRSETQEQMIARVDDADAELLSAVWVLGEPTYDELISFFSGQQSYLELHHRLLNVEDRLLVFRDGDQVRINQLLFPILKDRVLRAGWIFQAREAESGDPTPVDPWLDDALLISAYSYATERPELFKADGALRKRSARELSDRIPPSMEPISVDQSTVPRAQVLFKGLIGCRLLVESTGGITPIQDQWEALAGLETTERVCRVVAGWASSEYEDELEIALSAVYRALPEKTAVAPESIERLLITLARDVHPNVCRRAREGMGHFGMLTRCDDGYLMVAPLADNATQTTPLIIQPNFDVTLPLEIPFSDALFVARVGLIKRHDTYSHYEITKHQLASSLQAGLSLQEILERLRELSGGVIPQNVVISLETWAHEFESLRLYEGIILTADESRRHVIEHAQEVGSLIDRVLAPGVFLISRENLSRLPAALLSAGIDMSPELPERPLTAGPPRQQSGTSGMRGRADELSAVLSHPGSLTRPTLPNADDWREPIASALDDLDLEREMREELVARLDRKLILFPEQLDAGMLKTERTEARGLDYAGKVRIVEQAIRSQTSLLEIVERTSSGEPVRRLVEPLEVSKRGADLVLVANELPGRHEIQVLVSKLGLVRRIRAGLVKRVPTP